MTDDDHRELAEVLHEVDGMVILSGYESELYAELFCDWTRYERNGYRDTTVGDSPPVECLWINPACINNHMHPPTVPRKRGL